MTPEERDKLQDEYVHQIIDDMDIPTLISFVTDSLSCTFDDYSDNELVTEINLYYPEILNEQESKYCRS